MLHDGQPDSFEVKTSDDRKLAVEISGDHSGAPVVLLHGTPGSRNGPKPRPSVLYRLGVQLITYDRPGYGGSTRRRARRVADTVHDVQAIVDELGHRHYAVVGRSGGAPHALACAALGHGRVTRAAALVSVAPPEAAGLDWFDGMANANVEDYRRVDADLVALGKRLAEVAKRTQQNPEAILDDLRQQLTSEDRRLVGNAPLRRLLRDAYKEALRQNAGGWVDDVLALRSDWGFRLSDIDVPVLLWHGADDNLAPAAHTRWLARQIRGAELRIEPGSAHFGAVEALPAILAWLADGHTAAGDQPHDIEPHDIEPLDDEPLADLVDVGV